ncbi:MAG: hypothetical protein OPY03_01800 [Nitrosopumilus sp.]|nr:hypothetical protein [Nitrosopumilus sp.]
MIYPKISYMILTGILILMSATLLVVFDVYAQEPNITAELYGQITNGTLSDIEKENLIRYNEATKSRELHVQLQQALRPVCDDEGRCDYIWEYPEFVFRDGKVMKRVSEFGIYEVDEEKTKIMLDGIAKENFEGLKVVEGQLAYTDTWDYSFDNPIILVLIIAISVLAFAVSYIIAVKHYNSKDEETEE